MTLKSLKYYLKGTCKHFFLLILSDLAKNIGAILYVQYREQKPNYFLLVCLNHFSTTLKYCTELDGCISDMLCTGSEQQGRWSYTTHVATVGRTRLVKEKTLHKI